MALWREEQNTTGAVSSIVQVWAGVSRCHPLWRSATLPLAPRLETTICSINPALSSLALVTIERIKVARIATKPAFTFIYELSLRHILAGNLLHGTTIHSFWQKASTK